MSEAQRKGSVAAPVESDIDFEELARQIRGSYQIANLLREMIREELRERNPRFRRAGLPQSEMKAVMERILALRSRFTMTAEEMEQLIEEHRREIGRGPLVPEDEAADGD